MALSDYIRTRTAAFCATGTTGEDCDREKTFFYMYDLDLPDAESLFNGMAFLINDEICKLVDFSVDFGSTALEFERGCADTIPQIHPLGSRVWFYDERFGSDNNAYPGSSTITVKLLPATPSGGTLPLEKAPLNQLTFDFRFARPYPPGAVLVNGDPWYELFDSAPGLLVSWKHRNKVLQADVLISHHDESVAFADGTYQVDVYDQLGNVRRSITDIEGESWMYTTAAVEEDFEAELGTSYFGYLILRSYSNDLYSKQGYKIKFAVPGGIPGDALITDDFELLITDTGEIIIYGD